MSFNGTEGAPIDLATAEIWTKNYRDTIQKGDTIALFQGRNNLLKILDQEGCMGIRAYFAYNAEGKPQLVFVGADANENDMLGEIYDFSTPCPDNCSTPNPLNGL